MKDVSAVVLATIQNRRSDGNQSFYTERKCPSRIKYLHSFRVLIHSCFVTRYKQKYTWAQLPWIQIGVKQHSLTLLMDIVTMKLPNNALIFLTALGVEFNVNFLNRCRVNALSGEQVRNRKLSYNKNREL